MKSKLGLQNMLRVDGELMIIFPFCCLLFLTSKMEGESGVSVTEIQAYCMGEMCCVGPVIVVCKTCFMFSKLCKLNFFWCNITIVQKNHCLACCLNTIIICEIKLEMGFRFNMPMLSPLHGFYKLPCQHEKYCPLMQVLSTLHSKVVFLDTELLFCYSLCEA